MMHRIGGAILLVSLCGWSFVQAQSYTATMLPDLGEDGSWAAGINNAGQIVGWLTESNGDNRAVLWQGDSVIDLGLGSSSLAADINESGVIAARDVNGPVRIVNLVASSIGSLGGVFGSGNGINNNGQMVGASLAVPPGVGIAQHAYRWTSGSMTDLGTLGGFSNNIYSEAADLNDSGWVVGISNTASSGGATYGFVFRDAVMEVLPSIYLDKNHSAADINNAGVIVGTGIDLFGLTLPQRALVWEGNSVISIHGTISRQHSQANAINERGDIVGRAWNAGAPFGAAYVWRAENRLPISLNNVTTALDGWFLTNASDINDCGQIVCVATRNDTTRAFLLTPANTNPIVVTSPTLDELWVPGETYNIRWTPCEGINMVDLLYSLEWPDTIFGVYNVIAESLAADLGVYEWVVPEELSPRAVVEVRSTDDVFKGGYSSRFRIKGWELTRTLPDTSYEQFSVGVHGWPFPNDSASLWPVSWFSQFDYLNGTDPYTNMNYPPYFSLASVSAQPKDFPSWPLIVSAFGTNQMYLSTALGVYRSRALALWKGMKGPWRGSCFGFGVSTNLAFLWRSDFLAAYPNAGLVNELGTVTIASGSRSVVNELFLNQFGTAFRQWTRSHRGDSPIVTFDQVRNNFISETEDVQALHIYNQNGNGGHAVNPYKIIRHPFNPQAYWLYVYDNNAPGDTTRRLTIDTVANTWHYNSFPTWGGSAGMLVDQPVSNYLVAPVRSSSVSGRRIGFAPAAALDSTILLFTSLGASVHIKGPTGDSAGFEGGLHYVEIDGAVPLTPLTGYEHPPLGFDLVSQPYSIRQATYADSMAELTVLGDSLAFAYSRSDADSSQIDLFQYDASARSLAASNPDAASKRVAWQTIISGAVEERVFNLDALVMGTGDSLVVQELNRSDLFMANFGQEQNTPLQLTRSTAAGVTAVEVVSFTLPVGASARILPQWDSLPNVPITAWFDYDLDGIVDDTVLLNVSTSAGGDPATRPPQFDLAPNYPNPFNASTEINYVLPAAGQVSLVVYNIVGQRVAVLVDAVQPAGQHRAVWNGQDDEGRNVSSGVYFYRLTTAAGPATKKMLLLK